VGGQDMDWPPVKWTSHALVSEPFDSQLWPSTHCSVEDGARLFTQHGRRSASLALATTAEKKLVF